VEGGTVGSGERAGCGPRLPCIVAALGILALVAFLVVRVGGQEYAEAERRIASNAIGEQARAIAAGVESYRRDTGKYPRRLDHLLARRGPAGYRGPYLDAIPRNPGAPDAAWSYDPESGVVSDPTGRWAGLARPRDASSAESYLEDLALPALAGPDILNGGRVELAAAQGKTLLLYVCSGTDASLPKDLAALGRWASESVTVSGALLRGPVLAASGLLEAASSAGFPIVDLRSRDAEISRALRITETPTVLLCDDTRRVRARIAGPVDPDRLKRAADEVWAYHELVRLGR